MLLRSPTILEIHALGVTAGLDKQRTMLLAAIPTDFVAAMPIDSIPANQLLLDLRFMNNSALAFDGCVPLLEWLWTAQQLAGAFPARQNSFRKWAEAIVRGKLPPEARTNPTVCAAANVLAVPSDRIGLGDAAAVAVSLNAAIAALDEEGRMAAAFATDPLSTADQDIGRLTLYKALHDALHGLPQRFKAISTAIDGLATAGTASLVERPMLRSMAAQLLREVVSPARIRVSALPEEDRDRERSWIIELEEHCRALADASDAETARLALDDIGSLQRGTSPRIDAILAEIANRVPLRTLQLALRQISEALTNPGQHAAAQELRSTDEPLGKLSERLRRLAGTHKRWQAIDVDLASAERLWGSRLGDPARMRRKIRDGLQPLLADGERDGEEWVEEITGTLNDWESAELEGNAGGARGAFDRVCVSCRDRFVLVDKSLLMLCGELSVITRPLKQMLEIARP